MRQAALCLVLLAWWFVIAGHPPVGPFVTQTDCVAEYRWTVDLARRWGIITTIEVCEWRADG